MSFELKPCPNPECKGGEVGLEEHRTTAELARSFIRCFGCGFAGPHVEWYVLGGWCGQLTVSGRLWNALPRGLDAGECLFLDMVADHLARNGGDIQSDAVLDIVRVHGRAK